MSHYLFDNAVLDRHAQQASGRPVETPEEFADRLFWLIHFPSTTVADDAELLDTFLDRKAIYSRGEAGGIGVGLAVIVALAGAGLWGWTHSSSAPNGATVLGILIVAVAVLIIATFGHFYRRAEQRRKAYTAKVEKRLKQDTTGDHIWDA